jgi:O-acetyl-ADP-ribose deacetylase (regulator of RNase III)
MIRIGEGDLLNVDVEALVNTVNCVGVMGRGVALQFKNQFPQNFDAYAAACDRQEVQPGKMFVSETRQLTNPRYIINFPTKRHWRGNSRMEDIESGLIALRQEIINRKIRSIALPPLGCGLGGLNWHDVRPRIEDLLKDLSDTEIILFEPRADGDKMKRHAMRDRKPLTAYRAAILMAMNRYLHGLMEPYVTLLEVHKLAYFLQSSGLQLKLQMVRGHYGPYAENLRHVLNQMEGYYTSGYGDGGDKPEKEIAIVPGALDEARNLIGDDANVQKSLDRVQQLIKGFETPVGLELLATAHWAVMQENANNQQEVARTFANWNERKSRFTLRQIDIALTQLQKYDWLTATFGA